MNRKIKTATLVVLVISAICSGCANFNPRNQPTIDNNGKIEDIKSNQNGVMAELGKIRQEMSYQNSKLKEIQSGLLNLNAAVSRNENTGIQIIQGDGALIFIFSIIVLGMFLWYYRDRAIKSERATEMMAREIARFNSPILNESILKAAVDDKRAREVYLMIKRRLI